MRGELLLPRKATGAQIPAHAFRLCPDTSADGCPVATLHLDLLFEQAILEGRV